MTNFEYFVTNYRNSELLIDTNLLIVVLIGSTDVNYLKKMNTVRAYTTEDFQLLMALVKHFKICTTPHILTEASNLCGQIEKFYKERIFQLFSQTVINLLEVQVSARDAVKTPVFLKFGLTDSVIFKLAKQGLIILTDDFELYSYLLGNGAMAANMNHFRTDYLLR